MSGSLAGGAQPRQVNYEETNVVAYVLPDPLVRANGKPVTDAQTWVKKRRSEVLKLFETQMYGRSPGKPRGMKFEVTATDPQALGGKATRQEVTVWFNGKKDGPKMDLLLFLPNGAKKPVPAFLGMNFEGNHTVHSNAGIRITEQWTLNRKDRSIARVLPAEDTRGKQASRWQVEKVLEHGYALVTVYYGDVEPDFTNGWTMGVRGALSKAGAQTRFKPDEWGGISAWAWGLSRAMDYLETDSNIDAKRVALTGHSRLGKTSLWAGARDERFAIVISNDSGEGGASLARRNLGETTAILNQNFPHWFCGNFKQYSGRESALPFDQHELVALMAPRPVYVASAEEDKWADPRGEFLAAKHAEPVYRLFGKAGLGVEDMPAVNQAVGDFIGYHIRTGKHDVTAYDWDQYLHFADRHFKQGGLKAN